MDSTLLGCDQEVGDPGRLSGVTWGGAGPEGAGGGALVSYARGPSGVSRGIREVEVTSENQGCTDGTRSHGTEEMAEVEKGGDGETQRLGVRRRRTRPRRSGRLSLTGLSFSDACPRAPGPLPLTWYTLPSLVSCS